MAFGVGEFARATRRTIRAPVNPLDISTVVSCYPKTIHEEKCTLEPGIFHIEAAPPNDISILSIGPSSWWRDVNPEEPLLEISVGSIQVAQSIVRDYSNGLFMCNMGDSMPGLFFVPGKFSKEEVKVKFVVQIAEARQKQRNWYQNLVKAGDILWARSNGNPLAINDDMRLAVQELQLKEKVWMRDFSTLEMINCKFCGSLVKPGFPVCATCGHIVDEDGYKKLGGADKKVG